MRSISGRVSITLALVAALGACEAVEANRRAPAALSDGTLTPARAGAATYGSDASRKCQGAIADDTASSVADGAKQAGYAPPPSNGQLCAIAEAMLGWREKDGPRQAVRTFLARHAGLVATPEVVFATLETQDPRQVGERVAETIVRYGKSVNAPAWGIATERSGKEKTRVALVLSSRSVELQQVPRQLAAGQKAPIQGQLLGDFENPQVLVLDPSGKLVTGPQQTGKAFTAEAACGDRAGDIRVEIRAEEGGTPRLAGSFPIACGTQPPGSIAIAPPATPAEPAAQAAWVFDQLNAARKDAGLAPLKLDPAVAGVAQGVATRARDGASQKDLAKELEAAEVATTYVVQNSAAAPALDDASRTILESAAHRASVLSGDVTAGGIGVATGKEPSGGPMVYLVQVLVKELPPADTAKIKATLVDAIVKRRQAYKLSTTPDPVLDAAAQKYVAAVIAGGGQSAAAKEALGTELNAAYKNVEVLLGAKADPLDLVEEGNVTAKGKQLGVGVAQGRHPTLGKNAIWVAILIGEKRAGDVEKPAKPAAKGTKK